MSSLVRQNFDLPLRRAGSVLTILFANSIETWHERTAFAAVCHGQALLLAQRAAEKGWSIRYSCSKAAVMNRGRKTP
jgi:hypothetical protein